MEIFIGVIVALVVLGIIGQIMINRNKAAAKHGLEVKVNKKPEEARQIIKNEFPGILWADEGHSFRRRSMFSGGSYVISVDIRAEGASSAVRLWMSSHTSNNAGAGGSGAWGKIKKVYKKLNE